MAEIKVFLLAPTNVDPFRRLECNVVDRSHSENSFVVECPELTASPTESDKELVEKYVKIYESENDGLIPVIDDLLTRFLSEARRVHDKPLAWVAIDKSDGYVLGRFETKKQAVDLSRKHFSNYEYQIVPLYAHPVAEVRGVDVEKVWAKLLAIYVKLNGPFEDRDDYEDIITDRARIDTLTAENEKLRGLCGEAIDTVKAWKHLMEQSGPPYTEDDELIANLTSASKGEI